MAAQVWKLTEAMKGPANSRVKIFTPQIHQAAGKEKDGKLRAG
jgi:hypothetical protein